MDYYYKILEEAYRDIGTKPKCQYTIKFDHLPSFAIGKMDYWTKTITLDHSVRLRTESLRHTIRHEAMHVVQAEEDPERYEKMSQIGDSYIFRILFHDTILNPLEVETRAFEHYNIVTRLPSQYLWEYSCELDFVPFEWLIQNPVQAKELLRLHSDWGHLQDHINLPIAAAEYLESLLVTKSELVPEAIALSELVEELLQKLLERSQSILKLFSKDFHPFL